MHLYSHKNGRISKWLISATNKTVVFSASLSDSWSNYFALGLAWLGFGGFFCDFCLLVSRVCLVLALLFLNQVREIATITKKQFESYLTFVQNMHLNFVSQCSKTKTFGRCLKKALSRELQGRLGNIPQLFKASLVSCTDISIHFMENLRILQPLKSLENKLQQNIQNFRTDESFKTIYLRNSPNNG